MLTLFREEELAYEIIDNNFFILTIVTDMAISSINQISNQITFWQPVNISSCKISCVKKNLIESQSATLKAVVFIAKF